MSNADPRSWQYLPFATPNSISGCRKTIAVMPKINCYCWVAGDALWYRPTYVRVLPANVGYGEKNYHRPLADDT